MCQYDTFALLFLIHLAISSIDEMAHRHKHANFTTKIKHAVVTAMSNTLAQLILLYVNITKTKFVTNSAPTTIKKYKKVSEHQR